MWMITSLWGIILLLILGMIVLSFWPTLWDMVEARGRRNSHLMIDYSFAYMIFSVILSLVLGSIGGPKGGIPNVIPQLHQSNGPLVGLVMAGGFCGALADVCSKFAITLMGLVIAPSVTQLAQIVLSIILNYVLDQGLNNAAFLFPGLATACCAIVLGCLAHLENERTGAQCPVQYDEEQELKVSPDQPSYMSQQDTALPTSHKANILRTCPDDISRGDDTAHNGLPLRPHHKRLYDQTRRRSGIDGSHLSNSPLNTDHRKTFSKHARRPNTPRADVMLTSLHDSRQSSSIELQRASPLQEAAQPLSKAERASMLRLSKSLPSARSLSWRTPPGHTEGLDPLDLALMDSMPASDAYRKQPAAEKSEAAPGQQPSPSIARQFLGIGLALGGGILYGLYSAGWNVACNDSFDLSRPGVPSLSIYTTYFYNAWIVGIAMAAINMAFLFWPPIKAEGSNFGLWITDNNARGLSILSGIVASIGEGIQLMGGQVAGYAFSNIAQAYPLVSTLIGIVVLKQFRGASTRAKALVASQLLLYVITIVLLACSGKQRPSLDR